VSCDFEDHKPRAECSWVSFRMSSLESGTFLITLIDAGIAGFYYDAIM